MISEAATAGFCVGVLPVERKKSLKRAMEGLCSFLISTKVLSPKRLFGVPKFVLAIDELCSLGLARWIKSASELWAFLNGDSPAKHGLQFCEAKNAARWIVSAFEERESAR